MGQPKDQNALADTSVPGHFGPLSIQCYNQAAQTCTIQSSVTSVNKHQSDEARSVPA